ncbi:hypothetical protein [Streptomyces sp. TR06-5]|uniref:hypothetical protein n=1 Tax=unclassified Streptomyces TaxID=2593676 RepID=UPI0039A3936E
MLLIALLAIAAMFAPEGTILAGAVALLIGIYQRRQEQAVKQALLFVVAGAITLVVGLVLVVSGFTTGTGSDSPKAPKEEATQAP